MGQLLGHVSLSPEKQWLSGLSELAKTIKSLVIRIRSLRQLLMTITASKSSSAVLNAISTT